MDQIYAHFFVKRIGWFSWQVFSEYPDHIERPVEPMRFWTRFGAERVAQALRTHHWNGFDMGKQFTSTRPLGA